MTNLYTLKLSQNDVTAIMEGLGQLPLKVSVATFQRVQQQILQQDAEKQAQQESHEDKPL